MNCTKDAIFRNPEDVSDIVWLQTSFLGDVVLTTGGMTLVTELFPEARQHAISTAIGAKALAGVPELASRLIFSKGEAGFHRSFSAIKEALMPRLQDRRRTVVLKPHLSYRSSLLARFLGLPTVGFIEADLSWLSTRTVAKVAVLHEAVRIALLLEPLGVARARIVEARPRLAALELSGEESWAKAWQGLGAQRIAVSPGSVWGTKRWTKEGFATLAAQLLQKTDASLVFLGSDAERELCSWIVAKLEAPERVLDLAGRTSLDDLRKIFPHLSLLVTNDSSPIHYASAFDVPTVAIFGATVPEMGFGPLAPKSQTIGVELPCRPCSDHGPQECPLGHFRCMRDLKPSTVFEACFRILKDE